PGAAIGEHEGRVVSAKYLAQRRYEPAGVAWFERHADLGPERLERAFESIEVSLQRWRQLQQDRPESITQDRSPLHQEVDRVLRVDQPLDVRQVSTRFDREDEPIRHGLAPARERGGGRHPVEGDVQLDGREVLDEEGQSIAALDEARVERPPPILVVEAGCPDEDRHAGEPRASTDTGATSRGRATLRPTLRGCAVGPSASR